MQTADRGRRAKPAMQGRWVPAAEQGLGLHLVDGLQRIMRCGPPHAHQRLVTGDDRNQRVLARGADPFGLGEHGRHDHGAWVLNRL